MSFLFGSKSKVSEKSPASLDSKALRLKLQKLAEENQILKDRFEEQTQVAIYNKKLLDEYIGKVTTHDTLLSKLNGTIQSLKEKTDYQEKTIRSLRAEKAHIDTTKQKSTPSPVPTTYGNIDPLGTRNIQLKPIGGAPPLKNIVGEHHCSGCGREFQELEITNTKLILEQERLLASIQKSKEELAVLLTELKNEEGKRKVKNLSEEDVQKIFNIENMESLQELLEDAEQSGQILLFVDGKGNTWQITRREDIDLDLDKEEGNI